MQRVNFDPMATDHSRMRRRLPALALLALLLGCLPATRPSPVARAQDTPLRAAFVYLATVSTDTWSNAHKQGQIASALSLGIDSAYSVGVTSNSAERILREYADQGYKAIFSTSFDFADAVLRVAPDYPDVIFEQATGNTTAPNVGTYDGRIYQAWYLAGMVAGAMTRKNAIGYVAPLPIPEVVRDLNAFTLGARALNPNVTVYPNWIFTFADRAKERLAAQQLADQGVDVLARESDSIEPERVADERGLYAIGYNVVLPEEAALPILTAPVWQWSVYYCRALMDIQAGRWTNAPTWWGIPEQLVGLAPIRSSIPHDVIDRVGAEYERIRTRAFDVFTGPIRDNAGQQRLAPGETMSDAAKLSFDWLVDGVAGEIPH